MLIITFDSHVSPQTAYKPAVSKYLGPSFADVLDEPKSAIDAEVSRTQSQFTIAMPELNALEESNLEMIRRAKGYVRSMVGDLLEQQQKLKSGLSAAQEYNDALALKATTDPLSTLEKQELTTLQTLTIPQLEAALQAIAEQIFALLEEMEEKK